MFKVAHKYKTKYYYTKSCTVIITKFYNYSYTGKL